MRTRGHGMGWLSGLGGWRWEGALVCIRGRFMDRVFVGTKMVLFLSLDVLWMSECVLGYMVKDWTLQD